MWAGKRRTIPQSCRDGRKWRDSCRSSTSTSRGSKRYWMARWKMSSAAHRWRADKFLKWCWECGRTRASHDESRAVWLIVWKRERRKRQISLRILVIYVAQEKSRALLIGSRLRCEIAHTRRVSWCRRVTQSHTANCLNHSQGILRFFKNMFSRESPRFDAVSANLNLH